MHGGIINNLYIFAPSNNNLIHNTMSNICDLTGKMAMKGNKVSHSNAKSLRKFKPNLKVKRFYIPETEEWITLKVSTGALRTINKKGISAVLDIIERDGYLK
jgi:large subunit ribosomal protein L28